MRDKRNGKFARIYSEFEYIPCYVAYYLDSKVSALGMMVKNF